MASNQVTASPPKLLPGLLGGLFIGVLSALPIVSLANCCCLWVITGGMLAAWVQQQNHHAPITVVDGAIVGLLAGLAGAVVHYVVSVPIELFLGPIMAGMSDGFMRGARQDMPPELRRVMDDLGPQGIMLIGSILFGGVSLLFGMLGGILGAVFFKKPSPPLVPPVPPQPGGWPPPSSYSERPWPPPPSPPADERPPDA